MTDHPRHIVIDARIIASSTGRYVERLITNLEALDQQNRYTILVRPRDADYWRPSSPNFEVVVADIDDHSFAEQIRLPRLLRRLRPDLVHFCMPQQPLLFRGVKVTTVHDLTLLKTYNSDKNWLLFHIKQFVFRFVLRYAVTSSSALIVPSEYTKQDVGREWPDVRTRFVVTPEAADLLSAESVPADSVTFDRFLLYVGQQKDYKNLRRLAAAHQQLLSQFPDLGLVCVGRTGSAEKRNQEHFEKLGYRNIQFTGFVADAGLATLYRRCALFVFPSLREGFGLPGLEAMVHGAPVASSDRTSLPEVYGDAAIYFDPEDVDDMASAIGKVLADPTLRTALSARGADRVSQFSWPRMAAQTLDVYRSVLQEDGCSAPRTG